MERTLASSNLGPTASARTINSSRSQVPRTPSWPDTNDLRKARDLGDLQKQKQALFGLPNQSIVPPRDDDLPSNTVDITLAHVNKMISAKTVPRQLNQFGQTFSKAAASKERGIPVQFKIKITDLDEQSRTFLGTSSQSVPVCIILDYNISFKFSTATGPN